MKVRNDILKLVVSWKAHDPETLFINEEWSEVFPLLMARRVYWPSRKHFVVQFQAKAGLDFSWHLHEDYNEQLIVLSGEVALEVVKKKIYVTAGQQYSVPAGMLHRGKYEVDTDLLLIFTPKET